MSDIKKISKIALILGIILVVSIFTDKNVSMAEDSYKIQQVKEAIEYKKVSEDGEPDKYDVYVSAEDLTASVEFPFIRTSIDSILYEENSLFNVDFFSTNTEETQGAWASLRNIARRTFRICLYLAAAILLTLLIYIGVRIVQSSFSQNAEINIFGRGFGRRRGSHGPGEEENPEKGLTYRRLIEEWIKAIVFIMLIVYILTLINAFSNQIVAVSDTFKPEIDDIIVYVKGSTNARRKCILLWRH